MAMLKLTHKTERGAYIYKKEHTIDALLTLKASTTATNNSRAELCLSVALDRSSSMTGTKLDLVKCTMDFVIHQLSGRDELGVITFETSVRLFLFTRLKKYVGE